MCGIVLVCGKNLEHKRVVEYIPGRVSFSNMIIRKTFIDVAFNERSESCTNWCLQEEYSKHQQQQVQSQVGRGKTF